MQTQSFFLELIPFLPKFFYFPLDKKYTFVSCDFPEMGQQLVMYINTSLINVTVWVYSLFSFHLLIVLNEICQAGNCTTDVYCYPVKFITLSEGLQMKNGWVFRTLTIFSNANWCVNQISIHIAMSSNFTFSFWVICEFCFLRCMKNVKKGKPNEFHQNVLKPEVFLKFANFGHSKNLWASAIYAPIFDLLFLKFSQFVTHM